jgi:hypothetical protein
MHDLEQPVDEDLDELVVLGPRLRLGRGGRRRAQQTRSVVPAARALLGFASHDHSLARADEIKRDVVRVSGGPYEKPSTPRSPPENTSISRRTPAFRVLDSPFSSLPIKTKSGS